MFLKAVSTDVMLTAVKHVDVASTWCGVKHVAGRADRICFAVVPFEKIFLGCYKCLISENVKAQPRFKATAN